MVSVIDHPSGQLVASPNVKILDYSLPVAMLQRRHLDGVCVRSSGPAPLRLRHYLEIEGSHS